MARSDFASEEGAGELGEQIARLHLFSQTFSAASDFIRPEYGLEWIPGILLLRSGEQQGVIHLLILGCPGSGIMRWMSPWRPSLFHQRRGTPCSPAIQRFFPKGWTLSCWRI